ncbi:MAG: ABC transporter ATP-binding protein [Rhodothermales bacterium]
MRPLARLNPYFWKYKRLFLPGLLCAAAAAGFMVTVPIVVRTAVDSIPRYVGYYQMFGNTQAQEYLFWYALSALLTFGGIIIITSLISGTFTFLMRQTVVVASRHIEYDLRNELFGHLQQLSYDFYLKHATGDLITRATSDIEQVRRYIGPAFMYATRAFVTMTAALSVMLFISPTLTLYALIPMPFLAVAVFFVSKLVHTRSNALQQQYSSLTSRVQEALSGIRVLKAYGREAAEAKAFDEQSQLYRRRSLDLALVDAIWRPVFLILIGLSTIIVVWEGGRLVSEGVITIGNIAEFMIYVAYMTWPVASIGFIITMVQRASASMVRLNEIWDTVPAIMDGDATDAHVTSIQGRITFEEVRYGYEDGADVLKGLSFDIPAGQTLALVGRTGSGKTTLIEMIPRLIEPDHGTVKIDGRPLAEIPIETLRSSVSYVPQDVFLFSSTVADNIAFGRMDAERADVEAAAREAELLDNIADFPDGFETEVGERGITLSGGQKQRASIARALVRDPRILILDDALSAVDTNTEAKILGHLRKHYGHRTVVIVSHRISAVQDADLILVLNDGEIIERGQHADLVALGGLYADLYHKQQLEQEIEALG